MSLPFPYRILDGGVHQDELTNPILDLVKRADRYRAVIEEARGLIDDGMSDVAEEILKEALRDEG